MRGIKVVSRNVAGEDVFLRPINGSREAVELVELLPKIKGNHSLMIEVGALCAVCCICDESGNLLYSDANEVRTNSSALFLSQLATVALDISGFTEDSDELKNSKAAQ